MLSLLPYLILNQRVKLIHFHLFLSCANILIIIKTAREVKKERSAIPLAIAGSFYPSFYYIFKGCSSN